MPFSTRLTQRALLSLRALLLSVVAIFCFNISTAKADDTITFNLIDPNGPVTHESYLGQYLLLAIGYSSCPDVCPTTLYEFGYAMKNIEHPERLQPLFVTIDPVHDEINRLNAYTQFFDKRIVGLSGEMSEIKALAEQLNASFGYQLDGKPIDNPEPGLGYTVYHSALIYLIDHNRELVDVFDFQIGGDNLVEELNEYLSEAPQAIAATESAPIASTAASTSNTTPAVTTAQTKANLQCTLPEGFSTLPSTVSLKDLNLAIEERAGVQLLNLWALWCVPCRKEMPILEQWASEQELINIVTVNVGDELEKINDYFDRQAFTQLTKLQTEGFDLLRQLGGKGLPFNALFVDGQLSGIKSGIITDTTPLDDYAQCIAQ